MKPMRHLVTYLTIAMLGLPGITGADVLPPATLFAAEQEGQDVKLSIKAPEILSSMDTPRTILRIQDGVTTTVVDDYILAEETPASSEPLCGSYIYEEIETESFCTAYPDACHDCDEDETTVCIGSDCTSCTEIGYAFFSPLDISTNEISTNAPFCELYPAYSVDCDGDDEAECCLACTFNDYYEVWDRCVPPGITEYLFQDETEWNETSESTVDSFEVTDAGVACEAPTDTDDPVVEDTESAVADTEQQDTQTAAEGDTETEPVDSDSEQAASPDTDTSVSTDWTDTNPEADTATAASDPSDSETTGSTDTPNGPNGPVPGDTDTGESTAATPESTGGCSITNVGSPALKTNLVSLLFS